MADEPAYCQTCHEQADERVDYRGEQLCWSCFQAASSHVDLTDQFAGPLVDERKARSKGTLPPLPTRDAALSDLRAWLTRAFAPPTGYAFEGFERHGRRLSDPSWITFHTPAGSDVRFRFPEQRALAKPVNLRSSVVSITDGLCRMGPVSNPEAQDIWVALCSVAHVAAQQDEVEEFREQLDSFLRVTEPVRHWTLEPTGRWDTLIGLQAAGAFEPRHAKLMRDDVDERHWARRPIRLVDTATSATWVRVNELATYLRHVLGLRLGHGEVDGRMSEIGAARQWFEMRKGNAHPHVSLYLLPSHPDEESQK
jgi:hypothetical protein